MNLELQSWNPIQICNNVIFINSANPLRKELEEQDLSSESPADEDEELYIRIYIAADS